MSRKPPEKLPDQPSDDAPSSDTMKILHYQRHSAAVLPSISLPTEDARSVRVWVKSPKASAHLDESSALLDRALEIILFTLRCDRGLIALCDPANPLTLKKHITRARDHMVAREIVLTSAVLDATLVHREGIIATRQTRASARPGDKILTAMAAPLMLGREVIGLIYVDEMAQSPRFTEGDLVSLRTIANLAAEAYDPEPPPAIATTDDVHRDDAGAAARPVSPAERYAEIEKRQRAILQEALMLAKGSLTETAHILGISRTELIETMDELKIKPPS